MYQYNEFTISDNLHIRSISDAITVFSWLKPVNTDKFIIYLFYLLFIKILSKRIKN